MERERKAKDYMTREIVTLRPDMDLHAAMLVLLSSRISGAPVVDEHGKLVGILSEKDCFRPAFEAGYHQERCGPVSDYMSAEVETVDAETDIIEVLQIFLHSRYRRFPVLAGGQLVGQISRRDVLRALVELW
jgi:CBS domain-containing protein